MFSNLRRAVSRGYRRAVDLSHPARSPLGSAVVNCVVYHEGVRQEGCAEVEEALRRVRKTGEGFVWIGLHEPSQEEIAGLAALFGLHPLAVEDAVNAHQRPKVERYDDTLFSVFKTVRYVEHEELTATSEVVETGELMAFIGEDFVITIRHGGRGTLGPVREELEASPEQLTKGPAAVLHAMADHVVDDYMAVTDAVQNDIDAVETAVFSEYGGRGDAGRIYQLKRELLELRRAVAPLARPLQQLATQPIPVIPPEIRTYFRDVADHLTRATEQIGAYDALLDSILQAHLAQVTVAQNEDMRKITAWAAIVAVPTMVCGVYGMNFDHMPELHWTYGYPAVLVVMAVICYVIHRGFRRNGWL
ncbi:magnesium/cobalt transporter CorA [Streptomyces goshikiensis]|uniref:Magnesium transport protein CorA n=1 Tax=Streptomyces goshikiensis TaxID=1942 RepID=A0ABZ1RTJ8_9ACTN|nr:MULTISPECIES: magnesium/cobalt transporter CorA [Streptomyces]MBP0933163.1 magnesium/cobalt transporter CorA [Streptomyces sp. KCTC 0041BP]OKI40895.1 magnesium transporter CorA [Streptomyces sp. CB03578]PJN15514.1 magnesium and cobalt transport protein CorA [Streptomyces sp. CB02120-2]WSY01047.1 magnesium/cobalt transporter CorA [Streptomyces goshikiensis]GHD78240.1 magnesium transporter CorA [Streptomyces goshikiensis]